MDRWSRWSGRACLGKSLVAPFGDALNMQDPWHAQLWPVVPVVDDQDAIGVDVAREHQIIPGDDPLVQINQVFGQGIKGRHLHDEALHLTEVEDVAFVFHR